MVNGNVMAECFWAKALRTTTPLKTHHSPLTVLCLVLALAGPARAQDVQALVRVYPEAIAGIDGNTLVWTDGTRMPIDDGRGAKPFATLLSAPDIKDMFQMAYPAGRAGLAPAVDFDPGRVRNTALLDKLYGSCLAGTVARGLVAVAWLPSRNGGKVMFQGAHGAADQLRGVSDDLDKLPDAFVKYLKPTSGTYNCRPIAGTKRLSAHGHGIAIDISTKHAHYWQWTKPDASGAYPYRNEIPWEIVEIFEKHGFIWGGKWYHYDTMHFEYRPELLAR